MLGAFGARKGASGYVQFSRTAWPGRQKAKPVEAFNKLTSQASQTSQTSRPVVGAKRRQDEPAAAAEHTLRTEAALARARLPAPDQPGGPGLLQLAGKPLHARLPAPDQPGGPGVLQLAGKPLHARLPAPDQRAELQTAGKELALTRAQLDTAVRDLALTRAELETAGQELGWARAELQTAGKELALTRAQLDTAARDLALTRAELETAGQELGWARAQDPKDKDKPLPDKDKPLPEKDNLQLRLQRAEAEAADLRVENGRLRAAQAAVDDMHLSSQRGRSPCLTFEVGFGMRELEQQMRGLDRGLSGFTKAFFNPPAVPPTDTHWLGVAYREWRLALGLDEHSLDTCSMYLRHELLRFLQRRVWTPCWPAHISAVADARPQDAALAAAGPYVAAACWRAWAAAAGLSSSSSSGAEAVGGSLAPAFAESSHAQAAALLAWLQVRPRDDLQRLARQVVAEAAKLRVLAGCAHTTMHLVVSEPGTAVTGRQKTLDSVRGVGGGARQLLCTCCLPGVHARSGDVVVVPEVVNYVEGGTPPPTRSIASGRQSE